jgi:hypothetical protein
VTTSNRIFKQEEQTSETWCRGFGFGAGFGADLGACAFMRSSLHTCTMPTGVGLAGTIDGSTSSTATVDDSLRVIGGEAAVGLMLMLCTVVAGL